ncbi:hypothetical protein N7G274_010440 [Stereocaulon virgatum]|uniref:Transcription initiation factor TFIID subunit 4 n=1 Tax=Stereocaulon virgatum TaxID=373712 RepID=A0ABR3ZTK0_9LECA
MAHSGIDLREEEAALSFNFTRAQHRREGGYGATSGASSHTAPRDNYYMQNTPGDRNSFYGSGTFNQAAEAPTKSAEDLAAEAPSAMSVVIPSRGHYNPQARPGALPRELLVQGPDKNWVMKSVTSEELLDLESPYAEILALISLAAQERIRGLVEDAAALAKGRRMGSHGVVPLELADIATGSGASESVAGLPTPSNSAVSPISNPLKRSYSEMNKPLTPVSDDHGPATTKIFANPVAKALNKIAQAQRKAEEDRLAKRQRRSAAEGSQAGSGSVGTSGTPGEVAPAVEVKKTGKGKKAVDTATQKANEAQQHAATMQTMNYAVGLRERWARSYPGASNANGVGSGLTKERAFGEFREDKEAGAGIQLRDVISALEHDGKERKALQRAYYKQGQAGVRR